VYSESTEDLSRNGPYMPFKTRVWLGKQEKRHVSALDDNHRFVPKTDKKEVIPSKEREYENKPLSAIDPFALDAISGLHCIRSFFTSYVRGWGLPAIPPPVTLLSDRYPVFKTLTEASSRSITRSIEVKL
jgi:hypothetical protein